MKYRNGPQQWSTHNLEQGDYKHLIYKNQSEMILKRQVNELEEETKGLRNEVKMLKSQLSKDCVDEYP